MLKCQQSRQREALWEDFADSLTKDGFAQILDAYTEDNEALVVDTDPNFVNVIDGLMWWKACDPGEFKVGSKEYWESSMTADDAVPPTTGTESTMNMLVPQDVMPYPYNQMI